MSIFKTSLAGSTALTLLLTIGNTAQAQSAPPQQSTQIQEVVITAEKKTENLQKAPISVEVLKPSDIAKEGIKNALDLQQILPSVKFEEGSYAVPSIRGLGTYSEGAGVDSAVALVMDGIYLSHPLAMTPILFDMSSIEAALGPQGTLYGRNSNAGAINFNTHDPVNHYAGMASVGFGNYGEVDSEAMINIPLTDKLALRVAEGSVKHNSYNSDTTNNEDAIAARAKLLYKPSADFDIMLTVSASQNKTLGNTYGEDCPPGTYGVAACKNYGPVAYQGLRNQPLPDFNNNYIFGTSLRIDKDLGWAQLISLTGFSTYHFSVLTNGPTPGPTPWFVFHETERDKYVTQEVRLASEPGSKIDWVAGVFYSWENQPEDIKLNLDFVAPTPATAPWFSYPTNFSDYQSEAIFGNATVPLVGGLSLTGGVRYTHETKYLNGDFLIGTGTGAATTTVATDNSETQSRGTWKVGLNYDMTPQNFLYANASTGFKSGGLNVVVPGTLSNFAPETVLAEEIGSKNRFLDGRLQVDAAAFHYAYKGYQTHELWQPLASMGAPYPLAGNVLFPTVNSQTATFEGGELDVIGRVTPFDMVKFEANLLADTYGKFVLNLPYTPTLNFSNTPVALAPKATYTMSYQHVFTMPNDDTLAVGADSTVVLRHPVNAFYTTDTGTDIVYNMPTYHRTNVNLTYETAENGWSVTAYIRNIENVAVITDVEPGYPTQPYNNAELDPPRTFGFTVKKTF